MDVWTRRMIALTGFTIDSVSAYSNKDIMIVGINPKIHNTQN